MLSGGFSCYWLGELEKWKTCIILFIPYTLCGVQGNTKNTHFPYYEYDCWSCDDYDK